MLSRAQSLLAKASGAVSNTEKWQLEGEAGSLSTTERLALWRCLLLKVRLVFESAAVTFKVKTLLGTEVYQRLYPPARKAALTVASSSRPFYRVIGGEVMAKEVAPGIGTKDQARSSMDPTMCLHPTESLMPRGSKALKWWTCKLCLRRWERIPLSAYQPKNSDLNELDLVTFGKYAGLTYGNLYETDKNYVEWVLMTAEQSNDTSPGLQRLAKYFIDKERLDSQAPPSYLLPLPLKQAMDMELDELL